MNPCKTPSFLGGQKGTAGRTVAVRPRQSDESYSFGRPMANMTEDDDEYLRRESMDQIVSDPNDPADADESIVQPVLAHPMLHSEIVDSYSFPLTYKADECKTPEEVRACNNGTTWFTSWFPAFYSKIEQRDEDGQLVVYESESASMLTSTRIPDLEQGQMISCPIKAVPLDQFGKQQAGQAPVRILRHYNTPCTWGHYKIGKLQSLRVDFQTPDDSMRHEEMLNAYQMNGSIRLNVNRKQLKDSNLLPSELDGAKNGEYSIMVHKIERIHETNTTLITMDSYLSSKVNDEDETCKINAESIDKPADSIGEFRWSVGTSVGNYAGSDATRCHRMDPGVRGVPDVYNRTVFTQDKRINGADCLRFVRANWNVIKSDLKSAIRVIDRAPAKFNVVCLELPDEEETQFSNTIAWFLVNYYLVIRYHTEMRLSDGSKHEFVSDMNVRLRAQSNKPTGYTEKRPTGLTCVEDLHKIIKVGARNVIYFLATDVIDLLNVFRRRYAKHQMLMKLDELSLHVQPAYGTAGWTQYQKAIRTTANLAGQNPFAKIGTEFQIWYTPFKMSDAPALEI